MDAADPAVEDVQGRQQRVLDIAISEQATDLPTTGRQVVHLDQDPVRRMAEEVEAAQDLFLETLDVKREQIEARRVLLVQEIAQRARRNPPPAMVAPAEDEPPLHPLPVVRPQ